LKFSLGIKIDALFTDTIENLFLAGYASHEQKLPLIIHASTKLDLLKFFMQVAWEVKGIDHKQYAALAVPLNNIGKDIGNWQDYLQRKQPSSNG